MRVDGGIADVTGETCRLKGGGSVMCVDGGVANVMGWNAMAQRGHFWNTQALRESFSSLKFGGFRLVIIL